MSTSTSPVGRPPVLFPLFAGLDTLDGIGPKTASHFAQMQVTRPRDLLFTLPSGGADRRRRDTVRGLPPPVVATVEVEVLRVGVSAEWSFPRGCLAKETLTQHSRIAL